MLRPSLHPAIAHAPSKSNQEIRFVAAEQTALLLLFKPSDIRIYSIIRGQVTLTFNVNRKQKRLVLKSHITIYMYIACHTTHIMTAVAMETENGLATPEIASAYDYLLSRMEQHSDDPSSFS